MGIDHDRKVWELVAKRDQLAGELTALQNKIAGLEMAIAHLQDDQAMDEDALKPSVKGSLLNLLDEAGVLGLTASLAVQKAARRGVKLDRGSVSSMLSRFKREGLAIYDGERYRLKRYVGQHLAREERELATA